MPLIATAVLPPTWKRLRLSALIAFAFGTVEFFSALFFLDSLSAEADAWHLFGDGMQSALAAAFAYMAMRNDSRVIASCSAHLQAFCLAAAGGIIGWRMVIHDAHPRSAEAMVLMGLIATAVALYRLKVAHGGWDFWALAKSIIAGLLGQARLDLFAVVEAIHVFLDVLTSVFVLVTGLQMLAGGSGAIDRHFGWASAGVAIASAFVVYALDRSGEHHHDGCSHHH